MRCFFSGCCSNGCAKSLAYALIYQAEDRTLTDAQVAKVRNKIVKRVEKELGAELRGEI